MREVLEAPLALPEGALHLLHLLGDDPPERGLGGLSALSGLGLGGLSALSGLGVGTPKRRPSGLVCRGG